MCKVVSCCELAISHFIRKRRKTVIRSKALLCFRHTTMMHSSVEAAIENGRALSLTTWHWRSFFVQFFCILVSQISQVVVLAQINRGSTQTYRLGLLTLPKREYLIVVFSTLLLLRCRHLMVVLHFLDKKVFDSSVVVTVQITARH